MNYTEQEKQNFQALYDLTKEINRISPHYFRLYLKYLETLEQTPKVIRVRKTLKLVKTIKEMVE